MTRYNTHIWQEGRLVLPEFQNRPSGPSVPRQVGTPLQAMRLKAAVNALEYVTFVMALLMMSAAVGNFYVKVFNGAPPVSTHFVHLPFLGLMCLSMLLRPLEVIRGAVAAWPFMMLCALAVLSYSWSYAPSETLRESLFMAINGLYLAYAGARFSWKHIVSMLFWVMICLAIASLALAVAVPRLGLMDGGAHDGAVSGLWMEKNAFGQLGVFGTLAAFARMGIRPRTTVTSILGAGLFTLCLIASTSKTSLMAWMVVIAVWSFVWVLRRGPRLGLPIGWACLFFGGFLGAAFWINKAAILKMLGREGTFTGRTDIWDAVKINIQQEPLLGYGYSGFWQKEDTTHPIVYMIRELNYYPNHSHNSWIEMTLNLGAVGAALLTLCLIWAFVMSVIRIPHSKGAYFALPFLAAVTVIGNFESVLAGIYGYGGCLLVLTMSKMACRPTRDDVTRSLRQPPRRPSRPKARRRAAPPQPVTQRRPVMARVENPRPVNGRRFGKITKVRTRRDIPRRDLPEARTRLRDRLLRPVKPS